MAPVALACMWVGGVAWLVLVALAGVVLAAEWAAMCGHAASALAGRRVPVITGPGGVLAVGVLLACAAAAEGRPALGLGVLCVAAACVAAVAGGAGRERRSRHGPGAALALGVPYIGLGGMALVWVRAVPEVGRGDLIFLVLVVWASDVGAYVVGRLLGGPKLAPRISPGKTWSGAVGGLAAAAAVGVAAAALFGGWGGLGLSHAGPARAAAAALVLGAVSQAGDLMESWIKRRFGVKDSGRLIPGHGGLLDRLDGLLAAAPAAALLALAAGEGVALWQ